MLLLFISSLLQTNFSEMLRLGEPNFEDDYNRRIATQHELYMEATWRLVLNALRIEHGEGAALSKKDKDVVKDKYSIFNAQLDEITSTQMEYTVPRKVSSNRMGGMSNGKL